MSQNTAHCVRTATLVEPARHAACIFESHKDPIRCRIKGDSAAPWTKIPKVGVALALICVVTLGPIPEMHWP